MQYKRHSGDAHFTEPSDMTHLELRSLLRLLILRVPLLGDLLRVSANLAGTKTSCREKMDQTRSLVARQQKKRSRQQGCRPIM